MVDLQEKSIEMWRKHAMDLHWKLRKLEEGLQNIADGDIPRTVKIHFRDDGEPSKHDRCEHGQWFYEDCGCCIEDYARSLLIAPKGDGG